MVVAGLVPDEGEFDPVELQGYGSVADCLEKWAEDHSSGNLQPDLGDLGLVDAAGQTLPTGLAEPEWDTCLFLPNMLPVSQSSAIDHTS